jgi:hypothetical protein
MHRKLLETTLSELDGERAEYFGDIVNRLEADPRTEANANTVFTVLGDVMGALPIYLEAAELIGLLLDFTRDHDQRLRQIMFDQEFVLNPAIIRSVTGDFIVRVLAVTMEKREEFETADGHGSVQNLTWPYRETDLVDPDDDPEAWAEALQKTDAWRHRHGGDRRRSGAARIDAVAADKIK